MNHSNKNSVLRSLILPIYLPELLTSIGSGIVMLVLPLFALEMTDSYSMASVIFAMSGVGTLISDVPAGILIARIGVKAAILLGIIVIAISSVLAGLSDSWILLGGTMFLLGAGEGVLWLAIMVYIADLTSYERGRAMACVGGVYRIGLFIGPILGGFIAKYFSYSAALICAGIVMGSTVVFIRFLRPVTSSNPVKKKSHSLRFVSQTLVEYRSIFATAGVAVFGLQLLRAGRFLIIPLWGNAIGLDSADIGLVTGIPMALEMMMFYPAGFIMDRFGRKWTAVPCITILALAIGLIPFCHSFSTLLIVVLLASVGNGLGSGIVFTLGADFSPDVGRSGFLGIWHLLGDTGNMASPFLVGMMTKLFTLSAATTSVSAIGFMAAFVMLFIVKESKNRSFSP
jgi:MFS family permease